MFIELHLLQNFAPSCLNRDDVGAPKTCDFGGRRRARISSQCLKRAMRLHFSKADLLPSELLGVRTLRLAGELADRLKASGRTPDSAKAVADAVIVSLHPKAKNKATVAKKVAEGSSPYLEFCPAETLTALTAYCDQHWEDLASAIVAQGKKQPEGLTAKSEQEIQNLFKDGRAADIALFGRMLTDLPNANIDAACQVAHALSTNQVRVEMDYFTAVDDLKADDKSADAGAGMIGTVEYTSSCFYRFACVDTGQLARNLQEDDELTAHTLRAFLHAAVEAIPSGKQNTFAAHNRPSLVLAVVRDDAPVSLANAFVNPARPVGDVSLLTRSVAKLAREYASLTGMYGSGGIAKAVVCTQDGYRFGWHDDGKAHAPEGVDAVDTFAELVDATLQAAGAGVPA